MRKVNIAVVAALALTIGFSVAWYLRLSQPIQLEAGTWFGEQARPLGEFELIDHNGNRLSHENFRGKWHLLFFGYTHCPDICPASLQTLADAVKQIDDSDVTDLLQIVFVSVDPQRDSPQILKSYVEYFDPKFIGATAEDAILKPLATSLGITYFLDSSDPQQANYDVGHSSALILVDPQVAFTGVFSAPHDSARVAADLVRIIERY